MKKNIYDCLKKYGDSDAYPFHMPGHKRNVESGPFSEIYHMDITEIDGFDNLHQPESIIRDAQERAARLYRSEETFFLVNGSTSGILSAVSAISGVADRLIIARNCHKAVYHAAFLNRMDLYYVYPEICEEYNIAGEVKACEIKKEIEAILDNEKAEPMRAKEIIAGVIITSPTYDGIISDVRAIAEVVHSYGLPLIVDQAHGAHFGLHPSYPENAIQQGADIVIHSVHKTLPAPTQTALLHRNGKLINREKLRRYLQIYQSSSPSYLLMAGIDEAVSIASEEGFQRLDKLLTMRRDLQKKLESCKHILVCPLTEPGKLVISMKDTMTSGQELYDILREKYHLQMEMASGNYVLAILTMMDTQEGLMRLAEALCEIDLLLEEKAKEEHPDRIFTLSETEICPKRIMSIWEAYNSFYENINLTEAEGRISAEFINLYPPGIPILVPGEKISKLMINMVENYQKNGYTVQGISQNKIKVINPKG